MPLSGRYARPVNRSRVSDITPGADSVMLCFSSISTRLPVCLLALIGSGLPSMVAWILAAGWSFGASRVMVFRSSVPNLRLMMDC